MLASPGVHGAGGRLGAGAAYTSVRAECYVRDRRRMARRSWLAWWVGWGACEGGGTGVGVGGKSSIRGRGVVGKVVEVNEGVRVNVVSVMRGVRRGMIWGFMEM